MTQVEVYTPLGVLAGTISPAGSALLDGAALDAPVELGGARWYPNDDGRPARRDRVTVPPDDVLVVVVPETSLGVHANRYPIRLLVGPYVISGDLSTPPGFDPGRALTRPAGPFIPLRDAVIELRGRPGAGRAERDHVRVNRYAVEDVEASLNLGFYFPGARLVATDGVAIA